MSGHTRPRWEDQTPGQCWECGGFCLDYKGHTHGWRCRFCIEVYLDTALEFGAYPIRA